MFSNLIDEEIKRDEVLRQALIRARQGSMQRANAPPTIALPETPITGWNPLAAPSDGSCTSDSSFLSNEAMPHARVPSLQIKYHWPNSKKEFKITLPWLGPDINIKIRFMDFN